jgi:hypothetical protein
MDSIQTNDDVKNIEGAATTPDAAPAWELLEAGRYRPRRIRGSYRGRELG